MLERILHLFKDPKPEPLPEPDAKLALGALMVRVAKSDHNYQFSEIKNIDQILGHIYEVGPVEAAKLRATCERIEDAAPPTDEFGRIICKTVSADMRAGALEALWSVVLADGIERDEEVEVVAEGRCALGLSEAASAAAHDRALAD